MAKLLVMAPITDRIRSALEQSVREGKSLRSIARVSGVAHPTLVAFLKGRRGLGSKSIEKLDRYYFAAAGPDLSKH